MIQQGCPEGIKLPLRNSIHGRLKITSFVIVFLRCSETRPWPCKLAVRKVYSISIYSVVVVPEVRVASTQNIRTIQLVNNSGRNIALPVGRIFSRPLGRTFQRPCNIKCSPDFSFIKVSRQIIHL